VAGDDSPDASDIEFEKMLAEAEADAAKKETTTAGHEDPDKAEAEEKEREETTGTQAKATKKKAEATPDKEGGHKDDGKEGEEAGKQPRKKDGGGDAGNNAKGSPRARPGGRRPHRKHTAGGSGGDSKHSEKRPRRGEGHEAGPGKDGYVEDQRMKSTEGSAKGEPERDAPKGRLEERREGGLLLRACSYGGGTEWLVSWWGGRDFSPRYRVRERGVAK